MKTDTTAPAVPARPLDYRDLEDELHNAVNMSEVACDMIEALQGPSNHRDGGYRLTDHEMNLASFAVYHSNKLLRDLKKRWEEIHDSAIAAKGGGA